MRPNLATAPTASADRLTIFARAAASLRSLGLRPTPPPPAPTAAKIENDRALWALRDRWRILRAENEALLDEHEAIEQEAIAAEKERARTGFPANRRFQSQMSFHLGLPAINRRLDELLRTQNAMMEEMARIPARTLDGILFKIEASDWWSHEHDDLVPSVMADVQAYAEMQKTKPS